MNTKLHFTHSHGFKLATKDSKRTRIVEVPLYHKFTGRPCGFTSIVVDATPAPIRPWSGRRK